MGGTVANPPLSVRQKQTALSSGAAVWRAGAAVAASLSIAALCAGHVTRVEAKPQKARAAAEFKVENRLALNGLELVISDPSVAEGLREPVTDLAIFVSKSGSDIGRILTASDAESASVAGPSQPLFNVRLFVVAGGRLYSAAKGQCGAWANDVSRCTASCDGGAFALRRKASAPLEFLLGAIPGGSAEPAQGLVLSDCGFDETGEIRLVAKSARALTVVGLASE